MRVGAPRDLGSQVLGRLFVLPQSRVPGSGPPREKRPTGTVRVTAVGYTGSSGTRGPGSPAHHHRPGREGGRLRWAARGAWARQAVGGSAEAGTPGRAGAELIKARRREQGESRRVAVRPTSASASRPEFRPGRADTPARALRPSVPEGAAGPDPGRSRRPAGGRCSAAPHVRRPAPSAMARASSGPRTSL